MDDENVNAYYAEDIPLDVRNGTSQSLLRRPLSDSSIYPFVGQLKYKISEKESKSEKS